MTPRGCIIVMLEVGLIKMLTQFQVINGESSYHILLGHPGVHLHQCVPSTLHQCVKSSFKRKDIEILATKAPFDASEAHLVDTAMFEEVVLPGVNFMQPKERIWLKAGGGKEKMTPRRTPHPA